MTGDDDPMLDLAAILRSERELSEVSERRGPDDAEEPLSLLAALAADVDDDAPVGVGDLGGLPGEEPVPAGTGGPSRPPHGRRWLAAAVGLAAAVVGTTGVAAAGTHVFAPINGLFGKPSPSKAAAGPERSHPADPGATAAPPTGRVPPRTAPGRTPSDPRTTRYVPGLVVAPGTRFARPTRSPSPSASPETTSTSPSPMPSGDPTATASPTGSGSAHPTASRGSGWPSKGLIRLGRDLVERKNRP